MNTYNTGNALGSTDPRDLLDNASNLDDAMNSTLPTWTDRFGDIRDTYAGQEAQFDLEQTGREAEFQAFLVASGWISLGNYAAAISVTAYNEYVAYDGFFWRPAAGEVPFVTSGTWVGDDENKFQLLNPDDVLRQDLANDIDPTKGPAIIGFIAAVGAASRTVYSKLLDFVTRADYSSDAAFNAAKAGKLSRDASGRLRTGSFIAGTEELSGATVRDAFVVGRDVIGSTDCHGFADRTVISGVTDAGTYGSMDVTVRLDGAHTQNHVYAFQDRIRYNGSGAITEQTGFLSVPTHTGSGVMTSRYGADIRDIAITGGGSVGTNIGIFIRDLLSGTSKSAITILQTTGNAIFASGLAKNYFRGDTGIGGGQNAAGVALTVQGAAASPQWYAHSTTGAVQTGAIGDFAYQVVTGASVRFEVANAAALYAVRPGADNTQPLGDLSKRWSTVYAGTGAINTSDAREKTEVRNLTPAEIAASKDLARELGAYRWLSAVAAKGGGAREHIGMTVQRAIEIMESHGLAPFNYGFICYDEWEAKFESIAVRNPMGEIISYEKGDLKTPAGNRYSFRTDELLAFMAAGFEARLSALEDF